VEIIVGSARPSDKRRPADLFAGLRPLRAFGDVRMHCVSDIDRSCQVMGWSLRSLRRQHFGRSLVWPRSCLACVVPCPQCHIPVETRAQARNRSCETRGQSNGGVDQGRPHRLDRGRRRDRPVRRSGGCIRLARTGSCARSQQRLGLGALGVDRSRRCNGLKRLSSLVRSIRLPSIPGWGWQAPWLIWGIPRKPSRLRRTSSISIQK
jgi:hypothetical protein